MPLNKKLIEAAKKGESKGIIDTYIANQGDLNAIDDSWDDQYRGYTLLHYAVANKHSGLVSILLSGLLTYQANPNIQSHRGLTPLHLAAINGDQESAILLLDNDAQLELKDIEGYTPLHRAVLSGHVEMVGLLIEKGAKVNVRCEARCSTPLVAATQLPEAIWKSMIDVLIDKGKADVHATFLYNNQLISLVQFAMYYGKYNFVELFEEKLRKNQKLLHDDQAKKIEELEKRINELEKEIKELKVKPNSNQEKKENNNTTTLFGLSPSITRKTS